MSIEKVAPKDRVVFSQSAEALFLKAFGPRLDAKARTDLKALGLDLDKPLLPAYSIGPYNKCVEYLAKFIYPSLPLPQAHYNLGVDIVRGLELTMVGRAMVGLAKLVGTRKAVIKAAQNGSATSNYCKVSVEEKAPNHFIVVAEPFEAAPEFMQGALWATTKITGAKNGKVTILKWDPKLERVEYELTWDEVQK